MILRLSREIAHKIELPIPKTVCPPDPNLFADWSVDLFVVSRSQYVIFSNTKSLYSTIFSANGITDEVQLLDRAFHRLRYQMVDDGLKSLFDEFIAPVISMINESKFLEFSVFGTTNDQSLYAKQSIKEMLSASEVSQVINNLPMSVLNGFTPRQTLTLLAADRSG